MGKNFQHGASLIGQYIGEGVDPTQMCQTLVHKVAQSKQLMAKIGRQGKPQGDGAGKSSNI